MNRNVAIVHFNTPELTEACILSLRKHGGENYQVYVFDNSDSRPFTAKMDKVTVIDNTKGQVVNFDDFLAQYPNRNGSAAINKWGSDIHMISVQKLWELLPDGFLLLDSDILIKASVDFMFWEGQLAVGHVQEPQPGNLCHIGRLAPMLCYINVPLCQKFGIRYFDPARSWMLYPNFSDKRNWFDTGASFLADIRAKRNVARGKRIDIRPLMEHYKNGSWGERASLSAQKAWLEEHADLWKPSPRMRGEKRVAICAIARDENRYAVEWVEHYKKLGVSKIFIYDNYFDGETPIAETLKKYVESGLVETIDIKNKVSAQHRAYEQCYRLHGDEYAWIGFLDLDEYLRWSGRKKIESMFSRYDDADVVLINWRLMTDNGLTHYDPRPLKERFTEPMPLNAHVKYDFPENDHVKCFIRGGLGEVSFAHNPHCPVGNHVFVNAAGERVQGGPFVRPFRHDIMRIDHYWTKTADEWKNNKLARGFAIGGKYAPNFIAQQKRYFFACNEWTQEKADIIGE